MESESSGGIFAGFAAILGAKENALKLLLSLVFGYPLGFLHRYVLYGKPAPLQHVYFTLCGLALCYFNFGNDVIHSVANILLMYVMLLLLGGTTISIILAYVINMGYLCVGYYVTMTEDYEIKWTTPHCVLTLRLIGLAYDVYDGKRKQEELSKEQKETALPALPSLLEVCGHTYFFGGFLVGPQFPMKRYLDFVKGAFSDPVTGGIPESVQPGLTRLVAGLGYTALYQVSQLYFPDSYLNHQDFYDSNILSKIVYITFWGKFTLYKYVAAWVITEGVCILTGLTYNGRDENGNNLWDACRNIYIRNFEQAPTLQGLVQAFNVNTNRWMAKYVFKRLKFVGNKNFSQACTLFFLAIWHGFYSGYFMNFFLEFFMINFEKGAQSLLGKVKVIQYVSLTSAGAATLYCMKKFYAHFCLSYALISFNRLSYDKYFQTYASVYFFAHIFLLSWPLFFPTLARMFRSPRKPAQTDDNSVSNEQTTIEDKKEL